MTVQIERQPFESWIVDLKAEFAKRDSMTAEEASSMVDSTGMDCWREMYDDDMDPLEACQTEMSYWDDDGEDD